VEVIDPKKGLTEDTLQKVVKELELTNIAD